MGNFIPLRIIASIRAGVIMRGASKGLNQLNAEEYRLLSSSRLAHASGLALRLLIMLTAMLCVSCGQQPQAGQKAEPTPQTVQTTEPPVPWQTIEPPSQVGVAQSKTKQPAAVVQTFSGTGVVRLINLKEGWLEIDHEEIKGLMPAMQMEWSVKDRAMLKSVRVGDQVDFTIEDNNGTEVITSLHKKPPTR
jgi:Cu/Ag efflux protein CusF